MAGKIYVATQSAVVYTDDGPVVLRGGVTRVREGHPLLKGRMDLFEEQTVEYEVETARQAPKAEAKPEAKSEPKVEESKAEEPPAHGPKTPESKPTRGPRRPTGAGS